jgi:hypothetical protein
MTQSQGVALGWHVPRRWRSSPAAVKTSITWPSVVMAGGKCECRSPNSEVQSVRHSEFVIRHWPGPLVPVETVHQVAGDAVFLQHHGDGLRGVEGRVPLAAALGVADERLLELIGEAGEVRMQKCELRSSVSSTFEIPHSSLSRP